MKNKLNESDKKIKRTLIEAFVYKISINEDDVDIMLYLDNLINKNCDNIGGGEPGQNLEQFMYEYKIKRQYIKLLSIE